MSKPIWIRLRRVLERDADASSVELSRESAEEMLAEIKRLTAENEKLLAALERIADTDPDEGTQWFHEVARAALTGDKHE